MKILHTADWHVGRAIRGRSRHDEHRAVLAGIVDLAEAEEVDLVVVAGDQFDTAAPSPEAEQLVYRTFLDLARVAPVVVVAGNHDHPRRLEAVAPLLELGRVSVVGSMRSPSEGGVLRLSGLDVAIGLVPWVSQRGIVRATDLMGMEADEHGGKYERRMAAIIERLCAPMTGDDVNLMVGHVMVHGGTSGGGERRSQISQRSHVFDYSIPAQAFPPHLGYVALGHLHRQQRLPAPAPVWYAGSPLQLDFGETEDAKGVLVVEAQPGLPASVEFRPLEGSRRLRVVRGTLAQIEAVATDLGPDDYVKVVVDEPARAGLADTVRELVPQAVDVVIDERRRAEHGGRRPSRRGRGHRELFTEYLSHADASDDRVERLFAELLDEAHET